MNSREDQPAHLTYEQMVDYQEGRLSQEAIDLVEAHLATDCYDCQDELTWLQETQAIIRGDVWVQPPDELRAIARQVYREHFRPQTRKSPLSGWIEAIFTPRPRLVMIGAAALILLVSVGVVLVALVGQEPALAASVAEVTGLVEMRSAGSDEWLPLQQGMELQAGDRMRSGDDSQAALRFPDYSVTELEANSELSILQLRTPRSGEGQVVMLRQNLGRTQNVVESQVSAASRFETSRFEIETPSAKVTVKGTNFAVEVTESGATLVTVMEGSVVVTGEDLGTVVKAGEMASVLPDARPALGVPLPTSTPTPVMAQATESPAPRGIETEEAVPSATSTPEPTRTPSPTYVVLASPTSPPPVQPTSPPPVQSTSPPPPAQPTSPPPAEPTQPPSPQPTSPPPTPTKKTPPGLTKTPQPPGQTRNASSPGY
ncbi:MAG: FecR family protein [Candidatus Promineifilaceae bacterium]